MAFFTNSSPIEDHNDSHFFEWLASCSDSNFDYECTCSNVSSDVLFQRASILFTEQFLPYKLCNKKWHEDVGICKLPFTFECSNCGVTTMCDQKYCVGEQSEIYTGLKCLRCVSPYLIED